MQELNTLSEVAERFDNIEGINAWVTVDEDKTLVKVLDEDAIGQFFKICREHDLSRTATTREGIPSAVMDSWVKFGEGE